MLCVFRMVCQHCTAESGHDPWCLVYLNQPVDYGEMMTPVEMDMTLPWVPSPVSWLLGDTGDVGMALPVIDPSIDFSLLDGDTFTDSWEAI